jgi:hypothetical protein
MFFCRGRRLMGRRRRRMRRRRRNDMPCEL